MTARSARGGRWVQGAVAAAVSAVHHTRPGVGASAAEHAVWWHRNADALYLIAEHEDDPARAASVRADAATARVLAAGMAAAHTAGPGEPTAVPASADRWSVLDDAALAMTQADPVEASLSAPEAGMADAADVTDAMDAELMEVGW